MLSVTIRDMAGKKADHFTSLSVTSHKIRNIEPIVSRRWAIDCDIE